VNRDVYLALIIGGLLPVIGRHGGAVGSGVTLCILMIVAGLVGLVDRPARRLWRRCAPGVRRACLDRRRLPRARSVKRR
jgi:hypothetical protein